MLEAVIFDVDGLIIDSEHLHFQAYNDLLNDYGKEISENEYGTMVGYKTEVIIKYMKNKYNMSESIDYLLRKKNSKYESLIRNNIVPREGVLDLINKLYDNNYKLAIATSSNKKETRWFLSFLNIIDRFEIIAAEEDVSYEKPDPEILNFISRKLKISPSNCVVLEDSEVGIKAAKQAKMKCIAVPNYLTKNNDFSEADLVVETLEQISIEILEHIASS